MKRLTFKELIVFENEHFILVNKPPYISTLDERDLTRPSLIRLAKETYPDIQPCHRLDKETSGIIALAKTPDAYRHLSIQFERRKVDKTYHAVVSGVHDFQHTVVTEPIAVSNKGNVRIDSIDGKKSETVFNTLEIYYQHSLVECKPLTGRMHQIRIHLACLKAPITADILYGGKFSYLSDIKRRFNLKKGTDEEPLIKRVALHAYKLSFENLDGEQITVEAPYPKDLRALVNQLSKNK
ncbi:pseudouridine synthase [Rapidithrix thailandica]|uniref:Pseudouridine synthase n=1 Tax=Rapidithrix thailandica TaxID=413964 RepID=A0AAW9RSL7_9BACT